MNDHLPATPRRFLTVRQLANKHSAFTEGGLRHLIFHAKPRSSTREELPGNGLELAIVRVGRKVLIDEARFFHWIESQQRGTAGAKHEGRS